MDRFPPGLHHSPQKVKQKLPQSLFIVSSMPPPAKGHESLYFGVKPQWHQVTLVIDKITQYSSDCGSCDTFLLVTDLEPLQSPQGLKRTDVFLES